MRGHVYAPGQPLTPREHSVLVALATGGTDKDCAASLRIGYYTFKTHVKVVLHKLAARNRTHAVAIGFRRGLIH